MFRALQFICFAITIIIFQVFQITVHTSYTFDAVENKIQSLYVKQGEVKYLHKFEYWTNKTDEDQNKHKNENKNVLKKCWIGDTQKSFVYYAIMNMKNVDQDFFETGTKYLHTFRNGKNIEKRNKNKSELKIQNKNLPKKCSVGDILKLFAHYANMTDVNQGFFKLDTKINKNNGDHQEIPVTSNAHNIKGWITEDATIDIMMMIILLDIIIIMVSYVSSGSFKAYKFCLLIMSIYKLIFHISISYYAIREFYSFINIKKQVVNKNDDLNNLTEYELAEREHPFGKLPKKSLLASSHKKLQKCLRKLDERDLMIIFLFSSAIICGFMAYLVFKTMKSIEKTFQ